MNRILSGLFALSVAASAGAEIFTVDTAHADIGFSAKHMMVSNVRGSFNTFQGVLDYDIAAQTLNTIEGSIDATSIDTNNEKRDAHLKNEDFFNTDKHPQITFKSTSIKKTGDQTFEVAGKLNILGSDRDVVLPVTINGPIDGRRGGKIIGIECSTVLNRRDLGITHSPSAMIADEVKVLINAEAKH
jgi:polyisoprenoid-binding protein YceI